MNLSPDTSKQYFFGFKADRIEEATTFIMSSLGGSRALSLKRCH
jgi:hypothetical protein